MHHDPYRILLQNSNARIVMLEAWSFRRHILTAIFNDYRARYARSRVGWAWTVLHPLVQVLIFVLVLSTILTAKLPGIDNKYAYALFLTSGILAWSLFSELVSRCLPLFIDNGELIKKIRFPRICIPLTITGIAIINNLMLLLVLLLVFALLGHPPTAVLLWMPLLIGLTVALGLSIGLVLGVLNVFIRDVGHAVPVLLQLGFWFTPIVYPSSILPGILQKVLLFNPLYHVVQAYRGILIFHHPLQWASLIAITVLSAVLLAGSLVLFKRAEPELADAL